MKIFYNHAYNKHQSKEKMQRWAEAFYLTFFSRETVQHKQIVLIDVGNQFQCSKFTSHTVKYWSLVKCLYCKQKIIDIWTAHEYHCLCKYDKNEDSRLESNTN